LVDTFPLGRMESAMPVTRPPYPPEFRRQIVELHRAGRSIESLAREYEPSSTTIAKWVKQTDLDDGRRSDGLVPPAQKE